MYPRRAGVPEGQSEAVVFVRRIRTAATEGWWGRGSKCPLFGSLNVRTTQAASADRSVGRSTGVRGRCQHVEAGAVVGETGQAAGRRHVAPLVCYREQQRNRRDAWNPLAMEGAEVLQSGGAGRVGSLGLQRNLGMVERKGSFLGQVLMEVGVETRDPGVFEDCRIFTFFFCLVP